MLLFIESDAYNPEWLPASCTRNTGNTLSNITCNTCNASAESIHCARQVSYQLLTQESHLIAQLAQQRLLVDYLIDMRLHGHPLGRICKVQRHPGVVSCTCTTRQHRLSLF